MGDKLSGDYLFDRQYIKTTCQSLDEVVYKIIYNLNFISNKKYLKLFDVYEVIRRGIREELDPKAVVSESNYLIPLEEVTNDISDIVGSKLANLGELKNRTGMRVPDGFVFSTHAYKRFIEYNHVNEMLGNLFKDLSSNKLKKLDEVVSKVNPLILGGRLPPDLEKDLGGKLSLIKKKYGKNRSFAVRSSAREEDGKFKP